MLRKEIKNPSHRRPSMAYLIHIFNLEILKRKLFSLDREESLSEARQFPFQTDSYFLNFFSLISQHITRKEYHIFYIGAIIYLYNLYKTSSPKYPLTELTLH